jgi:hypothetical protein
MKRIKTLQEIGFVLDPNEVRIQLQISTCDSDGDNQNSSGSQCDESNDEVSGFGAHAEYHPTMKLSPYAMVQRKPDNYQYRTMKCDGSDTADSASVSPLKKRDNGNDISPQSAVSAKSSSTSAKSSTFSIYSERKLQKQLGFSINQNQPRTDQATVDDDDVAIRIVECDDTENEDECYEDSDRVVDDENQSLENQLKERFRTIVNTSKSEPNSPINHRQLQRSNVHQLSRTQRPNSDPNQLCTKNGTRDQNCAFLQRPLLSTTDLFVDVPLL